MQIKIIFLSLLISNQIFSQNHSVYWGVEHSISKGSYIEEAIAEINDELILIKRQGTMYSFSNTWLERYLAPGFVLTQSDALITKEAFNQKGKKYKMNYKSIKLMDGKMILLMTNYDKDKNTYSAYGQILDLDGAFVGDVIKLDEIETKSKSNRGEFDFKISDDGTRILMYQETPYAKHDDEEINFKIFDSNLMLRWENSFKTPYKGRNFGVLAYKLANDGNIYLLVKISPDKSDVRRGQLPFYYTMFVINTQNDRISEVDIDLKDKFVQEVTFDLNSNNDIVLVGFYSNDMPNNIHGTFLAVVDSRTGSYKQTSIQAFGIEILGQYLNEKRIRRGQGIQGFNLNHFLLHQDGTATLVAEHSEIVRVCTTDPRTGITRCDYYFYYNDIIVIRINELGKFEWYRRIPKRQVTVNDRGYYSGYSLSFHKGKIKIIFNDDPRNLANGYKGDLKIMNNPKRSIPVLGSISPDGSIEFTQLYERKKNDFILRPTFKKEISEGELVLLSIKTSGITGTKFRLGRLVFD